MSRIVCYVFTMKNIVSRIVCSVHTNVSKIVCDTVVSKVFLCIKVVLRIVCSVYMHNGVCCVKVVCSEQTVITCTKLVTPQIMNQVLR